jgi:hypothetical protein
MTVPVDDAVELLRDPAYRMTNGLRPELCAPGYETMNGLSVLNELQTRGADSRDTRSGPHRPT